MPRVLVLFAHPALQKSRVHRRLLRGVPDDERVTLHDLYERYPDFHVDVEPEQALLADHDVLVLQHPFYWYSVPPLLKQWIDLVLEHGWAYGSTGTALEGKRALSLVTTGGVESAYRPQGHNRHTVRSFLAPVEQTFRLCRVKVAPPWVIYGTHRLTADDIDGHTREYTALLEWLAEGGLDVPDPEALERADTLNGFVPALDAGAR